MPCTEMSQHALQHYRLACVLLIKVAHCVDRHPVPVLAVSRYPASSVLDWWFNWKPSLRYGLVHEGSRVLSLPPSKFTTVTQKSQDSLNRQKTGIIHVCSVMRDEAFFRYKFWVLWKAARRCVYLFGTASGQNNITCQSGTQPTGH